MPVEITEAQRVARRATMLAMAPRLRDFRRAHMIALNQQERTTKQRERASRHLTAVNKKRAIVFTAPMLEFLKENLGQIPQKRIADMLGVGLTRLKKELPLLEVDKIPNF